MATTAYSNILVEVSGGVATVTINRPPVNPLSHETMKELRSAFESFGGDDAVRAIVVTGAGQYVFIGGADINEFVGLDEAGVRDSVQRGIELFAMIENFPKPVIAAINGVCAGGGNELAMACDLRIAAESARISQPEVNLGIIPGWGGTQRLVRLVGKARALELILTGDQLKADDALRYGLVNKVVPDNEVLTQARNIARRLAMGPPVAIAAIKRAINAGLDEGARKGYEAEAQGVLRVFASADAKEGVSAFLSKRRPKFAGK